MNETPEELHRALTHAMRAFVRAACLARVVKWQAVGDDAAFVTLDCGHTAYLPAVLGIGATVELNGRRVVCEVCIKEVNRAPTSP